MYIRCNSNKINNLRMERISIHKHWTIKFESEIKWIEHNCTLYGNCNCNKHTEIEFWFNKKRSKSRINIIICAENKKEEEELKNISSIIDTNKYDTVIHLLKPGRDY